MNRHSYPAHAPRPRSLRRRAALAGAVLALLPTVLHARPPVEVPPVPAALEVPEDHQPFLVVRALGTQNYVCLPSPEAAVGAAWTLFGPQATLFDKRNRQVGTHFLSPNPDEASIARATWLSSQDSSATWAVKVAESSDPAYVTPDAIPWLTLQVWGTETGPNGGRRLADTTWIQRVETAGGKAPAGGCAAASDVGRTVLMPYFAKYVFFRRSGPL